MNFNKDKSTVMLVAVYSRQDDGRHCWYTLAEEDELPSDTYIRVSRSVEVEFIPLTQESVTLSAVETVDKQIKALRLDSAMKLERLLQARAELLCLSYQPGALVDDLADDLADNHEEHADDIPF